MSVPIDLKKALLSQSSTEEDLIKNMPAGAVHNLVQKEIVDKNGNKKLVWVNPEDEQPEERVPKQEEQKKGRKKKVPEEKVTKLQNDEETKKLKFEKRVQDMKAKYPHLEEEDIRDRIRNMIPMDATGVKIYHGDPKYRCEYHDNRGRLQKRYTPEYENQASIAKFERIEKLHDVLPGLRGQLEKDLEADGYGKDKICATVVKLIDKAYFRIGNEKYAEQNGTYGISTLKKNHLTIDGDNKGLEFQYIGKASMDQHKHVVDQKLTGILEHLIEHSPGEDLFQYQDEKGDWKPITDVTIRQYLKRWRVKPKDFRTYHATRLCANKLGELGVAENLKQRQKNVKEAIDYTAGLLGHTPDICKRSYISGEILKAYDQGVIMKNWAKEE